MLFGGWFLCHFSSEFVHNLLISARSWAHLLHTCWEVEASWPIVPFPRDHSNLHADIWLWQNQKPVESLNFSDTLDWTLRWLEFQAFVKRNIFGPNCKICPLTGQAWVISTGVDLGFGREGTACGDPRTLDLRVKRKQIVAVKVGWGRIKRGGARPPPGSVPSISTPGPATDHRSLATCTGSTRSCGLE